MSNYVTSVVDMDQSALPDDISIVLAEYSLPDQFTSLNLLATSQYAKVIFHDIADTYPTDADILCRYTLTNGVNATDGDIIALYKVGWSSVEEYLHFEPAPVQDANKVECQVLFKASTLPKDITDFYQLAYLTSSNTVCGLSVPFQFRRPFDEELCSFEEQDGLVIIRSKAAVTEEKLHEAEKIKASLQQEKLEAQLKLRELEESESKRNQELEQAVAQLESIQNEKKSLEKKLEESSHIERHLARLKQELQSLDDDKNEAEMKLRKAESHIQVLSATVDTLTSDKEHMSELLRNEAKQNMENSQYKDQVESLQYMLEVLTASKDMVTQELRAEMDLNLKLRAELGLLQTETNKLRDLVTKLEAEKEDLQGRIVVLDAENKDVKSLQAQIDLQKESNFALVKKVMELEENKNKMFAELTRISGKEKSDMEKICLLTEQLRKAMSDGTILQQQLKESTALLMKQKKETDLDNSTLEKSLEQVVQELNNIMKQKSHLEKVIVGLQGNLNSLQKELDARPPLSSKVVLNDKVVSLNCKREILETLLNELKEKDKIQKDRFTSIMKRLDELSNDKVKWETELQQVQQTYMEKTEELGELKASAHYQDNDFEAVTDGSWDFGFGRVKNVEEIQNLECFVESCHMRLVQLEQVLNEVANEKIVLTEQHDTAMGKIDKYKTERQEYLNQIAEIEATERKLLRQHLGTSKKSQGQDKDENIDATEMLTLMEDCSSLDKQISDAEKVQDLKLRLRLAAAEYRKLYIDKQKIEKRLARLMQKLSEKKPNSTSEEAQTEPLVSVADSATVNGAAAKQSNTSLCPFCGVTFPPGAYDLFSTHFENHLS